MSTTSRLSELFGARLLATKLRPPRLRPGIVPRPRVVERLDDTPDSLLTVVQAPAGSGKTTLVAQWLAGAAHDGAWVSLDADDNDPARFWSYAVAAIAEARPDLDVDELFALRLAGLDPRESVLPALLNQIDAFDSPVALVLDDYHAIDDERVHASLEFLLDHLEDGLRIVIVSRHEPPLPLPRMRARGQLGEIGPADLRFEAHEAGAMLGGVGVDLGSAGVDRLLERTEGWGAGLYLAGLSLRDRDDPQAFLETFGGDHRQIVDYLGEEALSGLDPDLRDFLVRTSGFDRFCAPLADAALGRDDGDRVLEALERSNLFLVPLDERRRWYRYHHLFRDLLAVERERVVAVEEAAALHRRAGLWFAEEGLVDEAIQHMVRGGAMDDAAELVAHSWGYMQREGWLVDADRWLSLLPEEVRETDVRLCLAGAWIAISLGRVEVAERWLRAAEAAGDVDDPASGAASCESARVGAEAYVAMFRGDPVTAERMARRAVEIETGTVEWRAIAKMGLAFTLQALLQIEEAERLFGEVVEMIASSGWTIPPLVSMSAMAECRVWVGDFEGAEELAARALELAERERHAEFPHGAQAHLVMGRVLVERGEHERGLAMTERGIELVERGSAPSPQAGAHLQRALAATGVGDVELAQTSLARAQALLGGLTEVPEWFDETRGRVEAGLAHAAPRRAGPARGDDLSDRERAVLRLLTGDGSLREIADSIFVSHNTIKTQVRSIYRKLGVSDRADAVAKGRSLGII